MAMLEMELTCGDELTVPELKTVCKQRKIGGYTGLRKNELVDLCCGKGAPEKVAGNEQTCKMFFTTAIIAGKLQNKIINVFNDGLKIQKSLKGADEFARETMDETMEFLFRSAINLDVAPVIYVKRFNDKKCGAVVNQEWTETRAKEVKDINEKRSRLLDEMAAISPNIAARFR